MDNWWKNSVINIVWVRRPPRYCAKVGRGAAKDKSRAFLKSKESFVNIWILQDSIPVSFFSCYTLMISMIMLSIILLSMLKIFAIFPTQNLTGNSLSWLLNFTLTLQTLWNGLESNFFCNPRKAEHASFNGSSNHGAKNIRVFLVENHVFHF